MYSILIHIYFFRFDFLTNPIIIFISFLSHFWDKVSLLPKRRRPKSYFKLEGELNKINSCKLLPLTFFDRLLSCNPADWARYWRLLQYLHINISTYQQIEIIHCGTINLQNHTTMISLDLHILMRRYGSNIYQL